MALKVISFILLLLLIGTLINGQGYEQMMAPKPQGKIAIMVDECLNTICKYWMKECHWFCDNVMNLKTHQKCLSCLGFRARHCLPCFEM